MGKYIFLFLILKKFKKNKNFLKNFNFQGILYASTRRAQNKFRLNRNSSSENTTEKRVKPLSTKNSKNESMNKTIITMTIMFLAVTLPTAYASFFFADMIQSDMGYFLIVLFNCITFSYHGLYFFLLMFSNNKFKREVLKLFIPKNVSNNNYETNVNQSLLFV